jgi:hypothetical protein
MHVFGEEPRECWLHCCFGWIDESFGGVLFFVLFFLVFWCIFWGGSEAKFLVGNSPALFFAVVHTNHRNKSLISMDRKQAYSHTYNTPFHIKVVYKGFNALSARKATEFGVGPKPIATREHREQIYRRFPA